MCCIRMRPRNSAAAGTMWAMPASWAIAAALASDRPIAGHRAMPRAGQGHLGTGATRTRSKTRLIVLATNSRWWRLRQFLDDDPHHRDATISRPR